MKAILFIVMLATTANFLYAETAEEKAVEQAIVAFARAGDLNDAATLERYLDPNYRVVMNRLFGSQEVLVMPREVFIEKIRSKEFGGDQREIKFEKIIINGNSAFAQVKFQGSKMTFTSLITLIKSSNGEWKLISEVPMVS